VGVSRETLAGLAERYELPPGAELKLERLLAALEAEPDAPTSARARADALRTHVADSLSGLEVEALRGASHMADLGAGAGFPGLVLAAALPSSRFDLIEATARKAAVAGRLAEAAGIANATVVAARAEDWGAAPPGAEGYEAVTARAVAPLAVLAEYAAPLLRPDGVLVAWKGERSEDEEGAGASAAGRLGLEVLPTLAVTPFAGARSRHLHVLRKVAPTPAGYPRRAGMARKRPLA
jgi:16S rRNA (guanine527-N7)-methyltransferase